MTTRTQLNRSTVTNYFPPAGSRFPGELFVNFVDWRLMVIDAGRNAQDLLAVRRHAGTSSYAAGDFATQGGQLYRAKTGLTPHAFNSTEWDQYLNTSDGDARWVRLAGSTMTGLLTLSGNPTSALHAVPKQYVDTNFATKAYVDGTFATKTYVDGTFLTTAAATANYASLAYVNSTFLTTATASASYASLSYVNSTFLTLSGASAGYVTRTAKGNIALGTTEPASAMAATPRGATFYGELVSTNGLVVNGWYDGANWHARETGPIGVTFVDWEPGLSGSWFWSLSASGAAGATVTTNAVMQLTPWGQLLVEHSLRVRPNTGVPDLAPAGKWGTSFLTLGGNEVGIGGSGSGGYILINGGGRPTYGHEFYWGATRTWALDMTGNSVQTGAAYATAYPGPSDQRLKTNIETWTARGLAEVVALQPVSFTWNGERGVYVDGNRHYGVIAQDAQQVLPEAVTEMTPGVLNPTPAQAAEDEEQPLLGWDNGVLIMAMVNAFKEVSNRLTQLEAGSAPA